MTPTYPRKTREMHNHHFDSTVWNDFVFRPDDVVISTYAKSGTTWTQQIVGQLIFQGAADVPIAAMSPWVDLRLPSKAEKLALLEAQTHRRFIKTHLPVDALRFSEQARYIYIGRDGRDVLWSMYHHHSTANEAFYAALNDTPGRIGPPIEPPPADIRDYFHDWLDRDGHPFWPFWENVRSWWDIRGLPNVLLVHFADLKRDMEGFPRDSGAEGALVRDPRTLQLRLDEGARRCVRSARRSAVAGWRPYLHQQGCQRPLARCVDPCRSAQIRRGGAPKPVLRMRRLARRRVACRGRAG